MQKKYLFLAFLGFVVACSSRKIEVIEVASSPVAKTKIGPCEPSIAIHRHHPDTVVIGTVLNGYHYSHDGGQSWTNEKLTSPFGVWGDPVLISDTAGNFHYFHLSDPTGKNWRSDSILDRIVCQTSFDGGKTWTDGTYMGLNYPKQQDKEWACVDPATNTIYVTWTQFDRYKSDNPKDESHIMFAKSTDGGMSWSQAKRISSVGGGCMDDRFTAEGAVPAVDHQGVIHVSWARNDTIWYTASKDFGETFTPERYVAVQENGWKIPIPGIPRANGFPVMVADYTTGEHQGNLYINWATQHTADYTEVYFSRSTDGGQSWSEPQAISKNKIRTHRFFTWMNIDPDNGNLYAVYYDRRNHSDESTDVYLAWSKDGGRTWKERKISKSAFKPVDSFFFGDYNHIDVRHGFVMPVWTAMEDGFLRIYTARIPTKHLK
jgi:hypothetical protein